MYGICFITTTKSRHKFFHRQKKILFLINCYFPCGILKSNLKMVTYCCSHHLLTDSKGSLKISFRKIVETCFFEVQINTFQLSIAIRRTNTKRKPNFCKFKCLVMLGWELHRIHAISLDGQSTYKPRYEWAEVMIIYETTERQFVIRSSSFSVQREWDGTLYDILRKKIHNQKALLMGGNILKIESILRFLE